MFLVVEGTSSLESVLAVSHDLLGTSYEEYTSVHKTLSELHEYLILGFIREIDEHISAYDKVTVGYERILKQIVFPKFHTGFDIIADLE